MTSCTSHPLIPSAQRYKERKHFMRSNKDILSVMSAENSKKRILSFEGSCKSSTQYSTNFNAFLSADESGTEINPSEFKSNKSIKRVPLINVE